MNIKPIGTMSTILVHDPFPDAEEQKRTKNRTNVLATVDKNKCS